AGSAVNVAANRLIDEEEASRRIRVLEGEPGEHQREEREKEHEVLRALALGHAHDHPGSVCVMPSMLLAVYQLAHKDHEVVEEHEADHRDDQQDVELAHP